MMKNKKALDGNAAAALTSYLFTETAAVYPITPSTPMAEAVDLMAAGGRKNLFGSPVKTVQMQSESGVSGAMHGSLSAGALSTTYTASQGLLLMIPDIYRMAGELLPGVIHVAARTVSTHALSIFGDHSDVYACRQTGAAMLCSADPQEAMDLSACAHLSAISGSLPFIHFFDGFRTSHEIRNVSVRDEQTLSSLLDRDAIARFRENALSPESPKIKGTAQNPDIFFQSREAQNGFYDRLPDIVQGYFDRLNSLFGTNYRLFNYLGSRDPEHIIVAMGSVTGTIEETAEYLNKRGESCGLIRVHLYRPFSKKAFVSAIPKSVKRITVLDRTKEPGAVGEPLYTDVCAALRGTEFEGLPIFSGRYGLASKDTTPVQIKAVFENREKPVFTIGINDDVTNLSLAVGEEPDTAPEDVVCCKFWGLGSDGTVGANKNTIKIIGDNTDLNVQGYFSYDSKKSGGLTVSHLRFGKSPIKSSCLIGKADFAACHCPSYIGRYDIVSEIKEGGIFLLNTPLSESELEKTLPEKVKRHIIENNISFYTIDAQKTADEAGTGQRINTVLQSAFFALTDIMPMKKALMLMKEAARAAYSSKGEEAVESNIRAIDMGYKRLTRVKLSDTGKAVREASAPLVGGFEETIHIPCGIQKGDEIPVSALLPYANGSFPCGTSKYDKRGIAAYVPRWIPENCIQCNFCSFSCPHSVIRPFALSDAEVQESGVLAVPIKPDINGLKFSVTPSVLDCTGCGICVNVCPSEPKALSLSPLEREREKQEQFARAAAFPEKQEVRSRFKRETVKGSQFYPPLLEFNGACAGCGEPSYAKLITQLFGERMYIANATGCSSIWGASAPSFPYTKNSDGKGPAWANSLFENNAEFGLGMLLAEETLHERALSVVKELAVSSENENLKNAANEFLKTGENADTLKKLAADDKSNAARRLTELERHLQKKSHWIFGGDGWAYDIGFGGLDHVLASGADINVFVFDTEVYSNTGGQTSKATPLGAQAQFSIGGKKTRKKDLGAMAMTYGSVYVAQVALGADKNQCVKAICEAQRYKGPSLIIGYSPCISHGIKSGMGSCMEEQKKAVEAGYWQLYRYDPGLSAKGKDPFIADSGDPDSQKLAEFLSGERRFV